MKIMSNEIKIVPIESIIPNPKNRNIHPEKQINALAKILEIRGFRVPLVISNRTGFLVSGHGRLLAAQKIGAHELPVIFQDFDNEADEYAHLIADNEISRYAEFDSAGFKEDLIEMGLDLDELNFEDFGLIDFNISDEWTTDSSNIDKVEENAINDSETIKVTCLKIDKDEVLIYLKSKLLETSFSGVHVE